MTNPLQEIKILGQSVWLDYIQRDILENGEVARMIEKDGLADMTSNNGYISLVDFELQQNAA